MRYFIFLSTIILLAACSTASPATENAPDATDIPATEIPATVAVATDIPQLAGTAIPYWQLVSINDITDPSVDDIAMFGHGILTRIESTSVRTGDSVTDIETALNEMMSSQNLWEAENVLIESITLEGDSLTIEMSGTITAIGGGLLAIVPIQFQLTVFEDPAINSTLITLNGENLANIGVSHSSLGVGNQIPFTRAGLTTTLIELR